MATRDQLLIFLKEKKGHWTSGETLSDRLVVSRSAVWKHVRSLKEEGYLIESTPKKGYRLRRPSPMLLPNEVREGLDTRVLGQKEIVHFRETDSTNTRAKEMARRGAPEGSIVLSETQSRGRGRLGRPWFSPAGEGIFLSLILRPVLSPSRAPQLTLLTAVAVAETLRSLAGLRVGIKWPNDILMNGKKLAGILTEITTEMDSVDYMVIGLGLNVNTSPFPKELRQTATSVLIEQGKPFSRVKLVQGYLRQQETLYEVFKTKGFDPILSRWRDYSNIMGHRIMVETTGETFTGTARDVDGDGFLILEDDQGGSHRIFSGDVTLWKE